MNTSQLRRTATAVCLVIWPASMLAAAVVQPEIGGQAADVYDAAATQAGRIAASAAIGGPGVLVWIVAVAGVVHLVRTRGAALANAGGVLALLGAVAHVIITTLFLVLLAVPQDGHRAELLPVIDRISGGVFPVTMPLLMLGALGVVLLAFALWRAGLAPLATPVLVTAALSSEFVPLPGIAGDIVLWVLVGAGLAPAALRVLRRDDAQPAHTPAATTGAAPATA